MLQRKLKYYSYSQQFKKKQKFAKTYLCSFVNASPVQLFKACQMKKVTASIEINNTASKVIDAFLQPAMLQDWWNAERCLIQPQSGGLYTIAWDVSNTGFRYVSSGIITVYQPGIMLVIEKMVYLNPEHPILGPMTLSILAEQHENTTSLHLTQDGYREYPDWDWYYDAVKNAWPQVLQTLKAYLEKE